MLAPECQPHTAPSAAPGLPTPGPLPPVLCFLFPSVQPLQRASARVCHAAQDHRNPPYSLLTCLHLTRSLLSLLPILHDHEAPAHPAPTWLRASPLTLVSSRPVGLLARPCTVASRPLGPVHPSPTFIFLEMPAAWWSPLSPPSGAPVPSGCDLRSLCPASPAPCTPSAVAGSWEAPAGSPIMELAPVNLSPWSSPLPPSPPAHSMPTASAHTGTHLSAHFCYLMPSAFRVRDLECLLRACGHTAHNIRGGLRGTHSSSSINIRLQPGKPPVSQPLPHV